MARFYGEVDGGRVPVHRLGNQMSGIRVEARGWNLGVRVTGTAILDEDEFGIYVTGGSHGGKGVKRIGTVRLDEDGTPTFFPVESEVAA